ncbi:oxidoreductase [Pyrrhoderma noxium]|uniref:Oxidoreductase n=1 Tax=Pyrrhoderma noxium TaxID=2282107 RepID=A0A286UL74_9AGAM|nr:oxidoreductase [Pyrrhoderma noxium]
MLGFGSKWDARGKNCYVTGGSQGLGLAIAILLAKKGANVTIIARNVDKLTEALKEINKHRQFSEQSFRFHSFPLNTASGAEAALEAESAALEQLSGGSLSVPDAFFLCAGSSQPGYYVEYSEEQLLHGMEQSYWVQAWSAHAAFKKLAHVRRPGKLVFVGSTLSLMSFLGYASYSPGKHALKGLAETLRSEGILYGIDVHIFFAPAMNTPGLIEETKTKPELTRKFEEDDVILSCETAADALLKGIERGEHHITATIISRIFNNSSRGVVPCSNPILGPLLDCIAWIALPFWRRDCDSKIKGHRNEHNQYLIQKGFASRKSD